MKQIDCSVEGFLGKFREGFARPNRYIVHFNTPPGIQGGADRCNPESVGGKDAGGGKKNGNEQLIQMSCHTCSMPSRSLSTYTHIQHSAPFEVPYSQLNSPVTFSFYSDLENNVRKYFDIWQTMVVNINDNSVNFYTEYTSDITITQIGRNAAQHYSVTLYGAYPVTIDEVALSYSNTNQVTNVSVVMNYKLWKAEHDQTKIVLLS